MLLKCLSCFIIIINFLNQTSYGKKINPPCVPSACGNIRSIRKPFRLRDDPEYCGDRRYELACENNITSIYFDSERYLVHAINYHNHTIRLTYPAIEINDSCSFPEYSQLSNRLVFDYTYRKPRIIRPIAFISCPAHVENSNSLLQEITSARCFNESNRRRRTYVKYGDLNGSFVMKMCTIDLVMMTSLPLKDENRVSLSEIHSSLLHGFEISFSWFGEYSKRCYIFIYTMTSFNCDGMPDWFVVGFNGTTGILWICAELAILINLALRILIGMPCMMGLLIYKLQRRRRLSMFDIIEGFLQGNNNLTPIRYSYSNIKKMTRGFREKLGQGGYGSVYKGKLRSGNDAAIKVLSNKSIANGQDFINEVATIGRIHHVNVVKLVGYCVERSKRALVYDFMPNGSLEKYIYGHERTSNLLSWERKYNIAIGVARGVQYLHQGCDIQILHFDIKPHNILLDDNFIPKVSDFGLAKFYSLENTTVTLTAARGTIGYVAPELINRSIGRVSYKADVYSFGMLLIEMLGLKEHIVADEDISSQYFPYWIYDHLNKGKDIETGKAQEIIAVDNDDDNHARKIIRKMTIVGLWCIQMSPDDRPSMSEVVKMLEGENENLQVPPRPSESAPINIHNSSQTWAMELTDSIALLASDASDGK